MGTKEKSLQEKLKVFFKKPLTAPLPAANELTVTAELERELGAESPLPRRLRAVRDVTERALIARVPEGSVQKLWCATCELLASEGAEARHAALALHAALAEGQADQLHIMRTVYFRHLRDTLAAHAPPDRPLRFRLLHALTNGGRNINCFEEQIGPFLLEWMAQVDAAPPMVDFLQLVTNVVKFNAAYLDEHVVLGIVEAVCGVVQYWADGGVVCGGLALLEAVVSYSLVPRAALPALVHALCRTVNVDVYCQPSWKLMRDVMGADIGHAALLEMVRVLRAPPADDADAGLARGAVFYVNMGLWGPRRVPALKVSFLAVLPAYLKALESGRPVVTYEVLVGLASAVERAPRELSEPAWDVLLRALGAIVAQDRACEPPNEAIHSRLHALISTLERMADDGSYGGDHEALLELVDACGHERPEESVLRLVRLRAAALSPTGGAWLAGAQALAERYLRREPRLAVRLHTLRQLCAFVARHRDSFGSEVIEGVGAPVLGACAQDAEGEVRAAAAHALAELAAWGPPDAATDLIDLLEKILNRPFEMYVSDVAVPAGGGADLLAACAGLVRVLRARLLSAPAALPLRCLLVLLDHLDAHYKRPALFLNLPEVRTQIFETLFALRVNAFNCVGWSDGACSPYLVAEGARVPAGGAALAGGRCARALGAALAREQEWPVLRELLAALPALLRARAPAVGRRAHDVDVLACTLCAMVSDRSLNFPECLRGGRPLASEFAARVLPALGALAPAHGCLEPQTAQRVVRVLLKHGMVLRAAAPHVAALTAWTLEARDTMVRMLPEVLLDLSKVSATQAVASPMLEFLSTLTRLPKVFASFVEDQYMAVFAIVLPYTNPSRYNHYVVSLAHHVIAAWFLKCRLPYRANFVRFIIHGLHNNIIMPFEEQLQSKGGAAAAGGANEDSSNRQRSSSLGSRAAPRVAARGAGAGGASAAFHVELTETCVDLLARYTSTPCSATPARSDTAAFLLEGGQAMTWLVGHKLVTVTTAGCRQNPPRAGPCERCAALCRRHAESAAEPLPPLRPPPGLDAPDPAADHAEVKRQPSGDGRGVDPLIDALDNFTQRFDRITEEAERPERWAGCAGGACGCWGARWAEVHVRSATGDVRWLMRLQNELPGAPAACALDELAPLLAAPAPERPRRAPDPHDSSEDSAVAAERRPPPAAPPPHRMSTQPINIPGTVRAASADTDMLLVLPEGKTRAPVRRSNSSPEMSSSWKLAARDHDDLILLAACEPAEAAPHKKPPKKSDTRVSCEAIPEEMSSTSPHHPILATFYSDPGSADTTTTATSSAGEGAAHHQLQKTASDGVVGDPRRAPPGPAPAGPGPARDELPPLTRSKRSNTISVMSPTRRYRPTSSNTPASGGTGGSGSGTGGGTGGSTGGGTGGSTGGGTGGVTPAFVFLQLYHNMSTYPMTPAVPGEAQAMLNPLWERPLRVAGERHERTLKNLDLVPPIETYKVGVLYVGRGQARDEAALLRNTHGSLRYADFVAGLGRRVPLDGAARPPFLNLERGGRDGRHATVWQDDAMQVLFHVATAMPTLPHDPACNEKRKYIGNDFVSIVYNDSGEDFDIRTIKGQLNFCIVVVEPLEHGRHLVAMKTKEERIRSEFLAHVEPAVVSDAAAAALARQTALHCALASHIAVSLRPDREPYASNALERLRLIKRLRRRLEAERAAAAQRAPRPYLPPAAAAAHHRQAIDDFNDYT